MCFMPCHKAGHCIAHNTKIDEIKVLQNHYEAFIYRSFHVKNFFHSKKNFREIEISKHKGFRFCKKSYFRKKYNVITQNYRTNLKKNIVLLGELPTHGIADGLGFRSQHSN